MIKAKDIFGRPDGQAFDLTQGVDMLDFFNDGVANPLNKIDTTINTFGIKSNEDTTEEDDRKVAYKSAMGKVGFEMMQNRYNNDSQFKEWDFGFEKEKNDVPLPNNGMEQSSNPLVPTTNFNMNPSTPSYQAPTGDFDPADFTFQREARKDDQGRLSVYAPPKGDGGGAYEVAGITAKYQPNEANRLKSLIAQGKHDQAEQEAKEFYRKRASPFIQHTTNKGLQLQLADSVHHRGEGGLRRILQRATGFDTKNYGQLISQLEKDPQALDRFNKARIDYEMKEIDRGRQSRVKFREGLMNRFTQAHQAAKQANS